MNMVFGTKLLLAILWYSFLIFLGICAIVVLIKLAFGTLHIHITVDNLDDLIGQKQQKNTDRIVYRKSDYAPRAESVPKVENAIAESPEQKELERFKELLRARGMLSKDEIDRMTYEDLKRFKNE